MGGHPQRGQRLVLTQVIASVLTESRAQDGPEHGDIVALGRAQTPGAAGRGAPRFRADRQGHLRGRALVPDQESFSLVDRLRLRRHSQVPWPSSSGREATTTPRTFIRSTTNAGDLNSRTRRRRTAPPRSGTSLRLAFGTPAFPARPTGQDRYSGAPCRGRQSTERF